MVAVVSQWTASQGITSGTGIPDPPSMPLECPVANTGSAESMLAAFVTWTLPPGYLGADMAVTDDAHNKWFPLGAPAASSPASGLTRSAIWAAPAPFAAGNVYVSPCGLPNPCYPAVTAVTVAEFSGISPYLGTPAVVTAVASTGTTISASCAAPSASALMLAVAASDGTVTPSGPGGTWSALTSANALHGGFHLRNAPAWQVSGSAQAATWTLAGAADMSAASAVILVSNPAPAQPNPNWPAVQVSAGFGSGALTPPGQITWTDITSAVAHRGRHDRDDRQAVRARPAPGRRDHRDIRRQRRRPDPGQRLRAVLPECDRRRAGPVPGLVERPHLRRHLRLRRAVAGVVG